MWLGGIRTSTMPRSGRCSSIAATNDGPSPTEPTTSWPASASSSWSPSRSSRESSATTTLITAPGSSRPGSVPTASGRGDLEGAVDGREPLAQSGEAESLGGVGAADAVVLDAHLDLVRAPPTTDTEADAAPLCLATLVSASATTK